MSENNDSTSIRLEDGKYTFRRDSRGFLSADRYDQQRWRDFIGDKAVCALFDYALALRERLFAITDEKCICQECVGPDCFKVDPNCRASRHGPDFMIVGKMLYPFVSLDATKKRAQNLELLIQATRHLLNSYGFDGPGHEAYHIAVTEAQAWLDILKKSVSVPDSVDG